MKKQNKIKLVIFDLDGTLVDAYSAIELSLNYAREKFALGPVSFLKIKKSVGWGDKSLIEPFFKKDQVLKALNIYRAHHKKALISHSRLFPFTKKLLETLKSDKIKLAVATNRPTKYTNILVRHLGIKKYFDVILCADKAKSYKPAPGILLSIMKKLKILPSEAFYVGDMTVDILAGKNALLKTIAVLTGSCTRKELVKARPFKILKNASFLPQVLTLENSRFLCKD